MTMKTVASREAQNNFGDIANIVKSGEEVIITQYGKPTMVVLPYTLAMEALRAYKARLFVQFMDSMPPAKLGAPELSEQELTDLIHELRS